MNEQAEPLKHPKLNIVVSAGLVVSTVGWAAMAGWFGAKYDGKIMSNSQAIERTDRRFEAVEEDVSDLQRIVANQAVINGRIDVTLNNISDTLAQINRKLELQ